MTYNVKNTENVSLAEELRKQQDSINNTVWEKFEAEDMWRCPACGEHNAFKTHIQFNNRMKCYFCGCHFRDKSADGFKETW